MLLCLLTAIGSEYPFEEYEYNDYDIYLDENNNLVISYTQEMLESEKELRLKQQVENEKKKHIQDE